MDNPFELDHPSDDILIRFQDGELPWWRRARVSLHVRTCWQCRRSQHQFQTAMLRALDAHDEMVAQLGKPPRDWTGFAVRLRAPINAHFSPLSCRSPRRFTLRWPAKE